LFQELARESSIAIFFDAEDISMDVVEIVAGKASRINSLHSTASHRVVISLISKADGVLANHNQQLTMNSRCASSWVLRHHTKNQLAHLFGDSLSADLLHRPRNPSPVEPETGPVPPNHRLRSDDDQASIPARPDPSKQKPEEAIHRADLFAGMPPL
jgi:hypothetical protein